MAAGPVVRENSSLIGPGFSGTASLESGLPSPRPIHYSRKMMHPQTADPSIHRLPPRLINQIAAGEVVTRPAAAVKELIENALDAGASRLEVTVEPDVLSFAVRDDGAGMSRLDLEASVERHATSKIRDLDDLHRLRTRGFRGEALAAIAAVSRTEILSRRRGEREGHRLRVTGGGPPRISTAGAPEGTTVHVRDLFYNTPARLKFLKTPVAEWGRVLQVILRQALTRADVGLAIRWKGKPYLDLPPGQSLLDRLAQILPSGAGEDLVAVDHVLQGVRVHGAVTGPNTTRRDRRHQSFFVNGRPIFHRPLAFAMEEAYRGLLMTKRYPIGALLIEMDPETVDVNVHPTKDEVRFRNEPLLGGAVHRAVLEALRAADLVPKLQATGVAATAARDAAERLRRKSDSEAPPATEPEPKRNRPELKMTAETRPEASIPEPGDRQLEFVGGFGLDSLRPSESSGAPAPLEDAPKTGRYVEPPAREEASLIARLRTADPPPRAVAQIAGTYILAESGAHGMLLIDQHAAHEKILYLKLMAQAEAEEGSVEVQPLMVPHQLEVSHEEVGTLEELIPALREAGFDVEPFGGRTFMVQSIPLVLEGLNLEAFIRDLLDEVGGGDLPRQLRLLRERICARAACRAAVMSGDSLTREEMQRLIDQLMETEAALRCPHGRPTVVLMTREMLDRQFGRL